jgi:glycosyltransferase involved in cell wall biosynthesis
MRVALVHDYLREYGGAERVLEELHKLFPDAPVYTSFIDRQALGDQAKIFADWDIRETILTRFPLYKKLFSPYRVFAAWAFGKLDLSEFDVVISSTNAYMAKAVKVRPGAKHYCYIHTPPRALYGLSTRTDWRKNPIIRVAGELINVWMRYVDSKTAQNPHVLIANSRTTQQRISKYYRRESVIIPPPVEMVSRFSGQIVASSSRQYLLFVGRLVLSKHPEIAVAVSNAAGYSLKVVGTGVMMTELKKLAGPQVEFLGFPSDEQLAELYSKAKLVLFPAEDEDFGMVPIEAMAAGTPVVTHFSGEPRFTVTAGESGEHVNSLESDDWIAATQKAWKQKWDHRAIAKSAQKYSATEFDKKIKRLLSV